ncbi:hypothetical protein BDP27DRAFT_1357310 [Rhodocollybia butyracea]|uniref:Uncharacterized protein n=1 Tax=Rhodocollybia butyracea TaxID=206335 RepID=A0A9P5Q8D9_9AGAR|nr:hypothetical protein BDP27DRAFT_1357310 [Rhodocollybia butyracea]
MLGCDSGVTKDLPIKYLLSLKRSSLAVEPIITRAYILPNNDPFHSKDAFRSLVNEPRFYHGFRKRLNQPILSITPVSLTSSYVVSGKKRLRRNISLFRFPDTPASVKRKTINPHFLKKNLKLACRTSLTALPQHLPKLLKELENAWGDKDRLMSHVPLKKLPHLVLEDIHLGARVVGPATPEISEGPPSATEKMSTVYPHMALSTNGPCIWTEASILGRLVLCSLIYNLA